jgi:predicted amidohydrolase YtcJ
VFVQRLDGHMALANSLALRLAGVTRESRDPDGGTIVRDAAGEPTGILKDNAEALVTRAIPEPSRKMNLRAARAPA